MNLNLKIYEYLIRKLLQLVSTDSSALLTYG